ncbi:hypothetical protein [Lysobacter sp. Hz 25]|uniref:hypothetical protein n=1 Tax=Lysobacter sp. Hz 25 TaxID=3383698 RepID=UPI0038D3D5C7
MPVQVFDWDRPRSAFAVIDGDVVQTDRAGIGIGDSFQAGLRPCKRLNEDLRCARLQV